MSARTRFGAARFASTKELKKAGLVNNGGLHHGYTSEKKPKQIGFDADTATIVIGPPGSSKYTSHFSYQLINEENTVYFDPKGEAAATTALTMPFADCYVFNPYALWTEKPWYLPASHRFNILDFVDSQSPMLFEDMLTVSLDLINKPKGGGSSEHFWGKAVQVTTCLLTFLKEMNPHASLVDFYNLLGDIRGSGEEDYFQTLHAPAMLSSSFSAVQQTASELLVKREQAPAEFESIMSTISNSVQILGSPAMQRVLSGKSTISMPELLVSKRPFKFYICIPVHLIDSCAGIIRALISTIAIAQQRRPEQRVHIIIDEAGQLGHFESLKKLFSFGRGSKLRVSAAFQSIGQAIDNFGKDGFDTLFGSAQSKIILGVASEHSARFISDFLGKQTCLYDPFIKQANASVNQTAFIQKAIKKGQFAETLPDIAKEWQSAQAKDAVARPLRTTEELIQMPGDKGLLSFHGLGVHPYEYQKVHYFENRDYAHRFLPNPFHPPFDSAQLPGRFWGTNKTAVMSEAVPAALAHFPQYAQGSWSYIKGHCPYPRKRRWFSLRK